MQYFDLIVIGSGSGLEVAKAIAQHGLKVAIVERSKMGGYLPQLWLYTLKIALT